MQFGRILVIVWTATVIATLIATMRFKWGYEPTMEPGAV
jgi:hypothetical protein